MLPSPGNNPNPTPEQPGRRKSTTEQQLNRACEACRLSKVRCLMNPASGSSQCQRCAKAGRTCVFAPPAKRRQRKRTDVRVAELEREVRQMRSLLKSNRISPVEASDRESGEDEPESPNDPMDQDTDYQQSNESTTTPANQSEKWTANTRRLSNQDCAPKDSLGTSDIDIIDRGLITKEMSEELLEVYRNELIHECPGIIIPAEWTAMTLRMKKPALFHAVMAAASQSKGASLSNRLHEEVIYLYARSIFIKGEKSLQYIQALLVTVAWYTPPNTPSQLQIYQYGNMAASMALELGLGSKPRTHEQLPKRAIRSLQRISSAEELLENCRTILVLYMLTAGFAMRLRRPHILLYNSWMDECLSLLQKSPILDDRRLVVWLKLQRISDEAMTAFGFDDASTSFTLSELRCQVILRLFDRRMQDWKKSVTGEVMTVNMMIEFYQNQISLWEFGMDGGRYDAPDFRNRHLTLPALDDDCIQPESLLSRSALQINSTIKCISAAHALLDCFLQLSVEKLRKVPNVLYVRCIYAFVVLLKTDYAIGADASGIGELLDSQSLKVDYYLDTVIRRTTEAVGPQKCRVPSHWLFVMNHKLKAWHDQHQVLRKEGSIKKSEPSSNGMTPAHATETASANFNQLDPQDISPTQPLPQGTPVSSEALQGQLSNYGIGTPYSAWPGNSTGNGGGQGFRAEQSLPTDMSDFTSAFQNGDLYFWNDANDNFGGWIPQGGLYSDIQFSSLNTNVL